MGMLLVGLVLGAVFLWSVSIGAWLTVRRERATGFAGRCPAWVPLPHVDGRLFRCGARVREGQRWCGAHAQPTRRDAARRHPHWERVEQTRAGADASTKMRWGMPLASAVVVGAVVVATVVVVR